MALKKLRTLGRWVVGWSQGIAGSHYYADHDVCLPADGLPAHLEQHASILLLALNNARRIWLPMTR